MRIALAVLAVLAFQACLEPAQAGSYTVVDVGNAGSTKLSGINAHGQAIGTADIYAFLREKDGTIDYISVPDNGDPYPTAINRYGDVAGVAWHSCGDLGYVCPVGFMRRANGTIETFYATGNPLDDTQVWAMNDARETAGYFEDASYRLHGFMRQDNGTVLIVDGPGAMATELTKINNNGYAAGTFFDGAAWHGLLVAPDGSQTVFDIFGAVGYGIEGMKDDGTIVGYYYHDGLEMTGFIRTPDGTITSISVDGSSSTYVASINRAGKTAGFYGAGKVKQGFVQSPSGKSKILKIKGFRDVLPVAISDRGVVAGTFTKPNSYGSFGFIWQP